MLGQDQINKISGFQLRINDSDVSIKFSDSGGEDIKTRVRDILIEAYEERFQRELSCFLSSTFP